MDYIKNTSEDEFSAEEFVDNLLNNGNQIACDETSQTFVNNKNLPDFYNEQRFKRAQQFYRANIFALLLSKLMGLVSILAVPSILKVLQFTKMSGEDLSAYKRYMATLLHMKVWYEKDFQPGSQLWQSIENVKNRHNSSSKRCSSKGFSRISQMDMALTQFGFMGFCITRTEMLGIQSVQSEDLADFVHLWRVVGHLMGIEERFNICRESFTETQSICSILIQRVFIPSVEQLHPDFITMSEHLINGMWVMHPVLESHSFIGFLLKLLRQGTTNTVSIETAKLNTNNNSKTEQMHLEKTVYELYRGKMTAGQKFRLKFIENTLYTLNYWMFRIYHNAMMHMSFFLMRYFPFLAFYKYGLKGSIVTIFNPRGQQEQEQEQDNERMCQAS